jgi:hypothetical protein
MADKIRYEDKPWLKSYEKGVPETIQYEEICLPDMTGWQESFPRIRPLSFRVIR